MVRFYCLISLCYIWNSIICICMGGQPDGIFLAGSLPYEFIILFVTSFICPWLINFSLSLSSSSTPRSRFSPPSNFVNGHVSTMWFVVCRWPQSHGGDWVRPHLCKLARHGPWPVRKRFISDHVWRGRWKPGCCTVGSVTIVWLTTEADDQSFFHWISVLPRRGRRQPLEKTGVRSCTWPRSRKECATKKERPE